jgi:hypothetical protein
MSNLDWDDLAYILAHLQDTPGKRAGRIRSALVRTMRRWDGDSGSTPTKDIKNRISYWKDKLGRRVRAA